jgi:hypothetical protein
MHIGSVMDDALDRLAADTAALDPRLRTAADDPECFMCGKRVRRAVAMTVETGSSIGLHAHAACLDNRSSFDVMCRYWKALRAAISGERETPNPAAPVVRGGFQ